MSDQKLAELGYTIEEPDGARVVFGGPALVAWAKGLTAATRPPLYRDPPEPTARYWDELLHPREAKGTPVGGRFRKKEGAAPATEDELIRAWAAAQEDAFHQTGRDMANQHGGAFDPDFVYPGAGPAAKEAVAQRIAEKLKGDPDFLKLAADRDRENLLKEPFPGYTYEEWNAKPIEERAAARLIESWAGTSSDGDRWALMLQQAAVDEFGLTDTSGYVARQQQILGPYSGLIQKPQFFPTDDQGYLGARKFLRAQYDLTQQFFAEHGITSVNVYRGMSYPYGTRTPDDWPGGNVSQATRQSLTSNPLSSWTFKYDIASRFAQGSPDAIDNSALLSTTIPVSRILATPFSGFGSLGEGEFVALGGTDPGFAWTFRGEPPTKREYDDALARYG